MSGDGRGCNGLSGKFLITDIVWRGGTLITFTAAFEQHCEQGDAALRGCVHYDSGYDLGEGGEGGMPSEGGASGATDSESAG